MDSRQEAAQQSESWRTRAGCRDKPTEWWYSPLKSDELWHALAICGTCPVATECREYAVAHHEVGLWGSFYRPTEQVKYDQHRGRGRWRLLNGPERPPEAVEAPPEPPADVWLLCPSCSRRELRRGGTKERLCERCCSAGALSHRRLRERRAIEREVVRLERAVGLSEREWQELA